MQIAQCILGLLRTTGALAVAASLAAVAAGTADARIAKRLDYDTGDFRQWTAKQALRGGATIVRNPRRNSGYAARFEVGPGDNPIGATGERAEVWSATGEQAGRTSWWKWSTRFPKSFRPTRGDWNVFTQWHHTGPSCQPSVSFVVDAHRKPYHVRLKVNAGSLRGCTASTQRSWPLGALHLGRWQTFVLHVHWSPNPGRGFVEVWRNGRKVLPRKRVATLYYGHNVYVKQGFYRAPAGWRAHVYHDGLRRYTKRPPSLR